MAFSIVTIHRILPSRYNADNMEMVRMENLEERNTLPKTKWNIPQPTEDSPREEAMQTGERAKLYFKLRVKKYKFRCSALL